MDGRLNKIATPLILFILLFLLIFLFLLAQILYILYRRRRLQRLRPGEPNQKSFFLFWRNQSRIQPKEIPSISKIDADSEGAVVETAGDELEKWQELCGPSRTLFTIKEEEEREGIMECFEYNNPFHKLKTDEVEDTTPFHTPSASPPYFTPSSSPTRDFPTHKGCSEDNMRTPFSGIQITTH
ncbi:uncharacterized protein LOC105434980 [Cucumis sativus]|uniref:uncharacterized protein LOC105434980 n=1 Tax=Cucumis sativus TaxID=3659 RepID=UPI0012F4DB1A|nr:uncharacterized protein LOC105434980 [Cucumis sativus]